MTSLHLGACGVSTIHHNRLSSKNQEGTRYFESPDPRDLRIDSHTYLQTLVLLSSMRTPVMGTDQDGTITIRSDGKHCQLFEELRERKLDLVSLKDGFSLSSPAGRLHARILAAEYETKIWAERVHAGQQVVRRKSKTWGGSENGWRWRVTDEQVTAIQEMKAARTPIAKIARITGLSRPTIYRVLSHLTQVVE